jgi:hypothetical protein
MELLILPFAGTFMLVGAELFDWAFGLPAHGRVSDLDFGPSSDNAVHVAAPIEPVVSAQYDRAA